MAITSIDDMPLATANADDQRILNLIYDEIKAIRNAFGGKILFANATVDVASLDDAVGATTSSIPVTGAALGDFVLCSTGVDLVGVTMTGYVDAADSVKIRFQNESGSTLDMASTTVRVLVLGKPTVEATVAIPADATALAALVLTKT